MNFFKIIKDQKKENRRQISKWYGDFEQKNQRKPSDAEANLMIKGLLDNRQRLIRDYTTMKAILIKQTGVP